MPTYYNECRLIMDKEEARDKNDVCWVKNKIGQIKINT